MKWFEFQTFTILYRVYIYASAFTSETISWVRCNILYNFLGLLLHPIYRLIIMYHAASYMPRKPIFVWDALRCTDSILSISIPYWNHIVSERHLPSFGPYHIGSHLNHWVICLLYCSRHFRSIIKIIYKSGTRTDPCGTSHPIKNSICDFI